MARTVLLLLGVALVATAGLAILLTGELVLGIGLLVAGVALAVLALPVRR